MKMSAPIRKTVIDINELRKFSPFFKSRVGTYIGNKLIKWLNIQKVNDVHSNNCHLRGAEFTSALLSDPLIDLKYRVHNEELLDQLPQGAFVSVSNHPIGSLDGIILIDIFASRRPDFKVMVNGVLTLIGAMKENFISVNPATDVTADINPRNINGVRYSLQRIKEGHPVGFFPAGAMSFYCSKEKGIRDLPWTHSVIKLIKKSKAPVIPVYFDFVNTKFFYLLGRIDWRLRTLRVPTEAFNKKGRTVDVYIGESISPEIIQSFKTEEELAMFLYDKTYALAPVN